MTLYLFAIDKQTFASEAGRDSSRTIERTLCIESINAMFQGDLFSRGLNRLII
jgi:hypothetical protein